MKLVKLNCPNCNGPLEIKEDQKKVKCKYCQTDVAVDDEIIKINHTIYSGDKDEKLRNVKALIKFGEYLKAYDILEDLSEEYVYESKIWYLMLVCLTENFNNFNFWYLTPETDIEKCEEVIEKYKLLETDEELREENTQKYENYIQKLDDIIKQKTEEQLIEEAKVAAEEKELEEKNLKFLYQFLIFIVIAIIIVVITALVATELSSLKYDEIVVKSYFNNNGDFTYKMQELKNTQPICYHFNITSKKEDKLYKIFYSYYVNGEIIETETYSDKKEIFEDNWVCYKYSEDSPAKTGEHKFILYVEDNYLIDEKTIKVVE